MFGLTAAELELDVLTGENCVRRVDLYEDAGQSLSPWVDIGQAEGAFVMGMGLFLTERHRFNQATGRKLTNRTWVRMLLLCVHISLFVTYCLCASDLRMQFIFF